jgi:hypothetical protein
MSEPVPWGNLAVMLNSIDEIGSSTDMTLWYAERTNEWRETLLAYGVDFDDDRTLYAVLAALYVISANAPTDMTVGHVAVALRGLAPVTTTG